MDIIDNIWCIDGDFVKWNAEDNEEHLFLEDGETYGGYLPEGVDEWEGYTVAYSAGNQCGQWITVWLNNEKQTTLNVLEEKFG